MIICKACQSELPDGSVFCGHCGAKIKTSVAAKETAYGMTSITPEELAAFEAAKQSAKVEEEKLSKKTLLQEDLDPQPLALEQESEKSSNLEEEKSSVQEAHEELSEPQVRLSDSSQNRVQTSKKKKSKKKRQLADTEPIIEEKNDDEIKSSSAGIPKTVHDPKEDLKSKSTQATKDKAVIEVTQPLDTQELSSIQTPKKDSEKEPVRESLVEMGDDDDDDDFDLSSEQAFFGGSMSQIMPALKIESSKPKASKKIFIIAISVIIILIIALSIALWM